MKPVPMGQLQAFIKSDAGAQISYSITRHPSKTQCITLLHGVGGCLGVWQPYVDLLKKEFTVITMDLRGHGFSHRPWRQVQYQPQYHASDVRKVLAVENISSSVFVGHSYGAIVSMDLAKHHPHLVNKLILLGIGDAAPISLTKLANNSVLSPILQAVAYVLPRAYKRSRRNYQQHSGSREFSLARIVWDLSYTSLRGYVMNMLSAKHYHGQQYAEDINCESLIVSAQYDTLFPPESGLRLQSMLRNSKHIMLEDSEHNFVVTRTDEITNIIKQNL